MALSTAPVSIEASRAVSRGRRGVPTRIALDLTDALAPCVEGQALCDEVGASVERIALAAAAGSRRAVVNEANRLGFLAGRYRQEFGRMALDIEGPEGNAA